MIGLIDNDFEASFSFATSLSKAAALNFLL